MVATPTSHACHAPSGGNPRTPGLPPREARAHAILAAMPAVVDDGFGAVLDALVERTWRASVVPRMQAHAPALAGTPFFEQKLRAGFHVYAALGMSAIACSSRRPAWIAAGSTVARALSLPSTSIAAVARRAMPGGYGVLCRDALDAIAVASAFILALDEVFDDELAGRPHDERRAAVKRIASAGVEGGTPCAIFASALAADLRSRDAERWRAMGGRLDEWARAELRLEAGEAMSDDEIGRATGIAVSMELLAFALPRIVGPRELAWMQGIALLGQMVDDVLDVEKDLAAGRVTHGASGHWSAATIRALYERLVADTRALVVDGGERYEATLALYERTVRGQLRHMAEVLVANP